MTAVAVIGAIFTSLGYVPNATQTVGSQAGIVWLMSFIPGVLLYVAEMFCIFMFFVSGLK